MMEGYLDISGCADKWRKEIGVDRIPVRVGSHDHDIDVMEHLMAYKERKNLRAWIEGKYIDVGWPYNKDLPVGFNLKTVPPGSVLHLEG